MQHFSPGVSPLRLSPSHQTTYHVTLPREHSHHRLPQFLLRTAHLKQSHSSQPAHLQQPLTILFHTLTPLSILLSSRHDQHLQQQRAPYLLPRFLRLSPRIQRLLHPHYTCPRPTRPSHMR